jgi:hypothetical protein
MAEVDIVIGADAMAQVLLPSSPRRVDSFLLQETIFGCTILGSGSGDSLAGDASRAMRAEVSFDPESLWSLTDMGVSETSDTSPLPVPEFRDGRFEVGLPFRSEARPPSGRGAAQVRLMALQKSLARRPAKAEKYHAYFQDLLARGIIEKVTDAHVSSQFYLPHHGIWKGDRLRVVFDGSAGLNQHLETGPNLMREIVPVLSHARLGKKLLAGDIQSAFLMVSVREADRKYLAFLWDNDEWRFRRVVFGLSCSPFLLQHVLGHMFGELEERGDGALARRLRRSLYVDDICCPHAAADDTAQLQRQVEQFLAKGGMTLHKVRVTGADGVGALLGVQWDSRRDTLSLPVSMPERLDTKRRLLKAFAGVYDPLGWLSPWTVGFRILFQELWAKALDWDQRLDQDDQVKLQGMAAGATFAREIEVPRYVGEVERVRVFVDASPKAYAACLYVGAQREQDHLLLARARVAPRHPVLTLPRLELMGALLGVRLLSKVRHLLPDRVDVSFWCDSSIALSWIRAGAEARWKLFVQNRVREIAESRRPGHSRDHE